jgi:acyl-coenzyme A synthetase/AMP-(fatty) acid ligase
MPVDTSLRLVGIEKTVSVDYIERVLACYREGSIAVPIDAGGAAPEGHEFAELIKPAAGGGWFTAAQAPIRDDRPAQVSFSSGTTGTPKAILLSHRALADVTDRLIAAMEIDNVISEYLGVPPTYSFGLGRARVVAAVGGRLFVPARGFDPTEFARMLAEGEINALSAVPTLLRALMSIPDLIPRKVARKLRWLEIGSQPMSAEEKQAIRRLFPAARIIQHYGLTEASRTTFLDIQEATIEELETVGRPIGETQVRIDAEDRICIKGPHVADGVLTADGLQPLVDSDGWLTTNDLGSLDEKGFLTFLGRLDHLLNVGGVKVSAELFEQRLADRIGADAAHVAIAARPDALRGQTVMVAHLAKLPPAALAEHARAVGASFGLGVADVTLVEIDEIPRTDTGKVQRSVLTERHGTAEAAPVAQAAPVEQPSALVTADASGPDAPMTEREREIAAIWHQALGLEHIGRNESFFDIGGDSLSAITVMLRMERAGIPKAVTQQIFEGRTIAEIAARLEPAHAESPAAEAEGRTLRAMTTDAISMTRAILVLLVISNHWAPFVLMRMGDLGAQLWHIGVPAFRMGTPGFAIVFGLGLGYFQAPVARRNPERLRGWMRNSIAIVGVSLLLIALMRLGATLLTGGFKEPGQWPTNLFFGVLTYYFTIALTAFLWLRLISRARYPIPAALLTMVCAYSLSILFRSLWLDADTSGLINLGRLMLVTRYSYPEMLGHTMVGMAIGLWLEGSNERPDLSTVARWIGLPMLIGGVMLSFSVGMADQWFADTVMLPAVISYGGAILLIFSVAFAVARHEHITRAGKVAMRIVIGLGTLAFPVYVAHEMVPPAVDILVALSLPYVAALLIPIGLFAVGAGFALRRVYHLYYG